MLRGMKRSFQWDATREKKESVRVIDNFADSIKESRGMTKK